MPEVRPSRARGCDHCFEFWNDGARTRPKLVRNFGVCLWNQHESDTSVVLTLDRLCRLVKQLVALVGELYKLGV